MLAEPFCGEYTAQPLSNRRNCNSHPFTVTLFCDLAIIYLRFRKFASLWCIPLPQPVRTDNAARNNNKLGQVAALQRKICILLKITSWIQIDSVAKKKKSICHLGVHKVEQSLQGTWSNASILHSTDKAAAAVTSPAALGVWLLWFGACHFRGKGRSSDKCPKESSEKDQGFWKYSALYRVIPHKAGDGSLDTLESCCGEKNTNTHTKKKKKGYSPVPLQAGQKVVGFSCAKKKGWWKGKWKRYCGCPRGSGIHCLRLSRLA